MVLSAHSAWLLASQALLISHCCADVLPVQQIAASKQQVAPPPPPPPPPPASAQAPLCRWHQIRQISHWSQMLCLQIMAMRQSSMSALMGSSQAPAETARQEPVKACVQCGTTKTPQWREGPAGEHLLSSTLGTRRAIA